MEIWEIGVMVYIEVNRAKASLVDFCQYDTTLTIEEALITGLAALWPGG